jgi:uncharacterized protein YcfJ
MKLLTSTLLLAAAGAAQAQEIGQVVSRTALYQQVAVPRQTCTTAPVTVQNPSSGAGALMGAIAGGAVGSQFGGGSGNALATMAGVFGGAILGDRIENPGSRIQNQTTCTTQNIYENRLTGYQVVYDYAGKQYTVQLPQDPGPTLLLQVTPIGATSSATSSTQTSPPIGTTFSLPMTEAPAGNVVTTVNVPTPVIQESRVVYVPTPVYRSYPPVYTHINMGWGWHSGHGRRGGHWR